VISAQLIAIVVNAGGIRHDGSAFDLLYDSKPRNLVLHRPGGRAVATHQVANIESGDFTAFDNPPSSDHDPVGPMSPA
jgi:hypothetical protein